MDIINPIYSAKSQEYNNINESYKGSVIDADEYASEYFEIQAIHSLETGLKKVLDWRHLILLGIGCTIGAGIFVVTGIVAREKAGPALFLSYIFSGFACLLSSFSYAEFAGMSPTAGSAYGFTRATLGQFMGWVVGWDLILEYAVASAGVAQGWSKYFQSFLLNTFNIRFPYVISTAPWTFDKYSGGVASSGSVFDLNAVFIVIVVTVILIRGIKESAYFNASIVVLKLSVVLFVIILGSFYVRSENFHPFMPFGFFGISFFGYTAIGQSDAQGDSVGVFAGASIVFFSYVGFDAVTTNAEECSNPQRDLPIGIIGSLVISTLLYISISLVLVGMVPYRDIDVNSPISSAFGSVGLKWADTLISIGALAGLTSVLLVTMLGQPRILMAMARDGLLPLTFFTDIHSEYKTPYKITTLTSVFVALVAALIPMSVLVELVSMGTLMAFALVNVSVVILRHTQPDIPRPFRCPFCPFIPILGAFNCVILMLSLPSANWVRLFIWFAVGLFVYEMFSKKNAKEMRKIRKQRLQLSSMKSSQQSEDTDI